MKRFRYMWRSVRTLIGAAGRVAKSQQSKTRTTNSIKLTFGFPSCLTLAYKPRPQSTLSIGKPTKMLSQQLRNRNVADDRKAVLVSMIACGGDWVRSLIRVLDTPFSWEMPGTEFADNEAIEAFLRGREAEMTTKGIISFQGLAESRAFASKYSGRWKREQANCSFEMQATGGGDDSVVTILKMPHWYNANRATLPQLKEELEAVTCATVETLVPVISRWRGHA
jgi:hypothetical protein